MFAFPNHISTTDKLRAVPPRCIAGLGQGIGGCMKLVAANDASSKKFSLRGSVIDDARSSVVFVEESGNGVRGVHTCELFTRGFSKGPKRSCEVQAWYKSRARKFRGPYLTEGRRRKWTTSRTLEAEILDVRTCSAYDDVRNDLREKVFAVLEPLGLVPPICNRPSRINIAISKKLLGRQGVTNLSSSGETNRRYTTRKKK